ncbi:unnamed protein product, partial [Ixodes pacificus]
YYILLSGFSDAALIALIVRQTGFVCSLPHCPMNVLQLVTFFCLCFTGFMFVNCAVESQVSAPFEVCFVTFLR